MKITLLLPFLLLCAAGTAQTPDTIRPAETNALHFDGSASAPRPLRLRDDDPAYNKKYPWYVPAGEVFFINGLSDVLNTFVFKLDYGMVGFNSWSYNIKHGWEWDVDEFSANFFTHPYGGTLHFNQARSNGFNFYESIPFAFGGSLMWEYFGEQTLPSYNDLINTTLSGAFGGEILYRLSSSILDDETTGTERVFREAGAAILNPARFINRAWQGALTRVTPHEVYQKEPLGFALSLGVNRVNDKFAFGPGALTEMFDMQFDYGDPFEVRERKPFDYFKVRGGLNFGPGARLVDNISGHGMWLGKNIVDNKNVKILLGGFQYADYWNNKTFEFGAVGLGVGMITKLPVSSSSDLVTGIHLAAVPLAGTSGNGLELTHVNKDYEYGGGAEGRLETTLNFGEWVRLSLLGYFYDIHNYIGVEEAVLVGITKSIISVKLMDELRIGFEHRNYYNDRFPRSVSLSSVHATATEQRLFLELTLEHLNSAKQ